MKSSIQWFFGALARTFAEESTQWFLWLPVGLGLGAAVFLGLPVQPPIWLGGAFLLPLLILILCLRRFEIARGVSIIFAVIAVGFCAAQWRDASLFHPILTRAEGPIWLQGDITYIDHKEKAVRLTLDHIEYEEGWHHHDAPPQHVRVSIRGDIPSDWAAGDRVRVRAKLMPLTMPVIPGGFDYAILQYYQGLDATGYSFGKPQFVARNTQPNFDDWLDHAREYVRGRIFAALPDQHAEAAITSAIFTGKENEIPHDEWNDLRDTGLIHLIAISGIHVSFLAMIIFFAVRRSLAAVPLLALHWNLKKVAAVAALLGVFAYMLFCGTPLRGQRSAYMAMLTLFALLVDRRTISLRVLCIVAAGVVLLEPDKIYSVGFHLSFAAVAGLIAGFEWLSPRLQKLFEDRPWAARIFREPLHLIFTSVFTTLATMPFIFYNFQNTQIYGVLANIIAVPIVGLWVMPLGCLAFLLMPFRLDGLIFYWIGQSVDIILQIAHWVANLRGAVWHMPALPPIALLFFTIGFAWICIWQRAWRLFGIVIIAAGFCTLPLQQKYDLLVEPAGKAMALRTAGGEYIFQGSARENYYRETWAQWFGLNENTVDLDTDQPDFHCDGDKCLIARGGKTIALIRTEIGFTQACTGGAKILMTIKQLPDFHGQCAGAQIIRYWDTIDNGTYAFYFQDGDWRTVSVNDMRGDRPWVR